jgi:hypothetical protein
MRDWVAVLIIVVVWLVLQYVVFPKLGVST